ncbi:MAG: MFS transporter [Bacteroidota bacterium]|nr:MFS transporter [Bacteroidota bacterium]
MIEIGFQKQHSWRKWVEPWYLSYALLGISIAGVLPIILPLAVSHNGTIADVGLVIAALNLGGMIAPLWGVLGDRFRLHRFLLAAGILTTAAAIAVFPFASSLPVKIALALIQGAGATAAATVANLFIVEAHPKIEWDKRIGWLQTFYGGGQVVGLLLAGFLAHMEMHVSFMMTAGFTAIAFFPGWFMTKTPPRSHVQRPVLRHPPHHAELNIGSPQRFYHHSSYKALQHILQSLFSPFGFFLIAWLISFSGAAAFFSLYPVLMKQAYGVDPIISSSGFAVSAAIGLALYIPSGKWSNRFGSLRVVQAALIIRLLAFFCLVLMSITHMNSHGSLALLNFLFLVLAWPLLSVAGTAVTAQYSRSNEGEGLGIFNATTAVAGVIGALLGGWLAAQFGYDTVPILGLIGIAVGIVIIFAISKIRW